ncbi:MAG: hypothetical protein U9Q63_03275, partial [Patescibacteria group bacterium]|nr:hypothetical protein [Patescibacteria group bacterium]
MQDFLPDVNDLKINEDKKIVAGLSKKKTLSKKQITRLAIAGVFGLLIFFGVLASFLENRDKKIVIEKEKESLNERAKLIEKKPGQMSWLFYLDFNENNSFDYEEKVFSGVSVKVRKPGEAQILRTMPANVLGQVIIDDLAEGEYEINFDNYAKDNFNEGEFSFPGMYQIVRDEDNFKEFLPSSWQKVILDMEGYYNKVGVVEYKPESLLVLEGDNKILFYDPFRSRLIGWSNFKLQGSTLKLDKLYFLKDSKLKELDIKTRIVKTNMDWVYEVGEYKLSSDGRMMVYKENNQFQYKSIDCGSGAVLIDGN